MSSSTDVNAADAFVYVGTYADPDDASVPGRIVVMRMDHSDGSLGYQGEAGVGLEAGFLCVSPDLTALYAVDERKTDGRGPVGPAASVNAFTRRANDGSLTFRNSCSAFGPFPTYLSTDPTGTRLVVASHGSFDHVERIVRTPGGVETEFVYDDSAVALYNLGEDGSILSPLDVHVLSGHGVDPHASLQAGGHAQASAHAHSAAFDPSGQFVLVADKGVDRIYSYRVAVECSELVLSSVYTAPAGSAPRHVAFHPDLPFAFVTDELASTVTSHRFDPTDGRLTALSSVPSTTASHVGMNEPADVQVHPGGRFVYVNNRGEDSVVGFEIDQTTGELTYVDVAKLAPSAHPGLAARSLKFDPTGRFLLVADRPANQVLTFSIDDQTGQLTKVASAEVSQPAFILVVAG
jgi:6-phosphogluconolactonase